MTGRALVTGATGCLGQHLAEELVRRGVPVRALVRQSSVTAAIEALGVEVVRGSLLDERDLRRAVADVEVVYHLGGVVVDDLRDKSERLWREILETNVEGTERLARAAAAAGARRLVFVSSVRIFGFQSQMCWDEDGERSPSDLYSRGKALAEEALWRVSRETGLEVVSIRPRFIYGDGDRYVLPRLVQQARGLTPIVNGDAICDIVYARDCAEALIRAAERPGATGRAYNVTSGECLSLREILEEVGAARRERVRFIPLPTHAVRLLVGSIERGARAVGRRPPVTREQLKWYVNDHHFSIARARAELGYEPRYTLRRALAEIDLDRFSEKVG